VTVIHLVHGIHVEERGGSPRLLTPYLVEAGFDVRVRSYGKLKWWQARWTNEKLAACFADSVAPGDVLVTHSNGVAIANLICDMGVPVGGVVCIQGALDADRAWAPQVPWVEVIANREDGVLTASTLLFGHMWGALGRDGYDGPPDQRIRTTFTDDRRPRGMPEALGHSEFLTMEKLAAWGPWLAWRIRARLHSGKGFVA
jgi:hypothetical protein